MTSCLQSTPRLSATVADLAIGDWISPSQTDSVESRCGQPWWSAPRGWQREANHLIRGGLRTHPVPAHTSVDLPKCCSAMRNDCRCYAALCGQNPANVARWPDRSCRPTTVKPQLTQTRSSGCISFTAMLTISEGAKAGRHKRNGCCNHLDLHIFDSISRCCS